MEKYGFSGRLTKEFPSQIIVDVTEICNLECKHCPHPQFKKSEHYQASTLEVNLNEKIVDEVRDYGGGSTQYIRYTSNGEPLLHPKIFEMLNYAKEKSGCMVNLTTNGNLLDEVRQEKLLTTNIDVIDISIDAYSKEVYEKIRVKGDFEKTRDNIKQLIKQKQKVNSSMKVVVSFVEQEDNKHETKEFGDYWYSQGVDYVIIRRLHTCGGSKMDQSIDRNYDVNRKPCIYPWERIILSAKGYLSFCPASWEGKSDLFDYRITTIKDAWSSVLYNKLRSSHILNSFNQFSICEHCSDWQQVRWPDEGRSYAEMMKEFKPLNK